MEPKNACWSCGQPGTPVGGHAWLRRCETCDVAWSSQPSPGATERDRVWQKANTEDKIAQKFGMVNRGSFVDHGSEYLSSPA